MFVDTAVRTLFMEAPLEGKSPVTIDGIGYELFTVTQPDPQQIIELKIASDQESQEPASLEPLQADAAGKMLTAFFLHWKRFYGVRRLNVHNKDLYVYQIFPHKTSGTVIELFEGMQEGVSIRASAAEKPFLKTSRSVVRYGDANVSC